MRHYAHDSYQEAEILCADPLQLVRLLYRGALEEIGKARQCLAARDIAGRSRAITKALQILAELALSLDHERGGQLSRSLVEIYDYVQRLLVDANCRQIDAPLAEAQKLMSTLLEAWEQCRPATAADAPQPEREHEPVSCAG